MADPITSAALIKGGSLLGSAAIGALGGIFGNKANSSYSAQAMQQQYNYNLALQKQSQQWQEHMSNTAHTREVQDLRNAGLNPILSATGGNGASSGTAGTNSVSLPQTSAPDWNNLFELAGNVANLRRSDAETANINQNTALQGQQTLHEVQKINQTIADTELKLQQGKLTGVQAENARFEIQLMKAQRANYLANVLNLNANTAYTNEKTKWIGPEFGSRIGSSIGGIALGMLGLSKVKALKPLLSRVNNSGVIKKAIGL